MTDRQPNRAERRALASLAGMLRHIAVGALEVELPDGRRRRFGDGASRLQARVEVHRWDAVPRLVHGGTVGAGEAYVDGAWSSPDLVSLVRIAIANRRAVASITPLALLGIAGDRLLHTLRGNRVGQAARNIAAHYDLSNELYALFLDPTMTYSAAYFPSRTVTLEEAQEAKYRRIAEKLRIGPGDRVLEVGCGWGGFATFAARTYGCRVTGITLSPRQAAYATERVRREGLTGLVDIEVVDYRHVTGRFDRIVSIEMLEAVGHRYLGTYFGALDRLLAPDGLVGLQVITLPEQRYRAYRRRPDFIQRHIFPGGHLPSLEALTASMGRASHLYVHDVENLGMHYAETLRRWRERFLANRDEVLALGFDERFVRLWTFYLAYCEAAFLARYINDLQIVLTRPMNATLGVDPYASQLAPVAEADLPAQRWAREDEGVA